RLEMVRERCPDVAIVLLSAYYDVKGLKALREFSRGASVGCAYLLKHTIDTVEQLTQVIYSVAEGRIILDPTVMEGFIGTTDSGGSFLRELSPREVEVLSWMAKGYRNATIAEVLCLESKTVERHINNIYSKLSGSCPASRHTRVHAVTLYLRATGRLPAEDFSQE
ncbi:MAG: response regulator transcription factor, partial [Dehalococcoidia bacterium]